MKLVSGHNLETAIKEESGDRSHGKETNEEMGGEGLENDYEI